MSKRGYRDGGIDPRGENTFRLRYRVNGERFTKTVHGSLSDARRMLRELLHAGDTGAHVAPDRITVADWIEQWLAAGAPGRKRKERTAKTAERYSELMRRHVIPALGGVRLQELDVTAIDRVYAGLAKKLAPRTAHMVHVVFNACLATAARKRHLSFNPASAAEAPASGESDHGQVLDAKQLRELIEGFKGTSLYPIVACAALTGARRNDILALRWSDFDPANKTLRIERALEKSKTGYRFKEPKTARGVRTITIDNDLVELLVAEREKYLRIIAGVCSDTKVNLGLVKLPEGALMFPSTSGRSFDLTKPRAPRTVTRVFSERTEWAGFKNLRFHDLRGSHETALLDAGVPVHVVAARCGHDPAVMLRAYAKRTAGADESAAEAIGELGILAGGKRS
jgi:integrase